MTRPIYRLKHNSCCTSRNRVNIAAAQVMRDIYAKDYIVVLEPRRSEVCMYVHIFSQNYRIHMDISNSENYLGMSGGQTAPGYAGAEEHGCQEC